MSDKPKWFVMLRGNDGTPIAMMRDDDNVALFDSEEQAERAGGMNTLGEAFGYEVFRGDKPGWCVNEIGSHLYNSHLLRGQALSFDQSAIRPLTAREKGAPR